MAKKKRSNKKEENALASNEVKPLKGTNAKGKKVDVPQYDFSTARPIPKGDRRYNDSPKVIAFLVDDEDGNEVVYHSSVGYIPAEAKKALGL